MLALSTSDAGPGWNWGLLTVVVTGFLAVWYLLPTPRRRPPGVRPLLVLLALAGFAVYVLTSFGRHTPATVEAFLFAAFALLAVGFAIVMITERNPARSAIYFAVVILNVCGLFLLQGAPFLSAATIIIYAGAIIVTFLFVIMLSRYSGPSDENDRTREPSLATASGFVLLATLLLGLQRVYDTSEVDAVIARAGAYAEAGTVDETLRNPETTDAYIRQVTRAEERLGFPLGETSRHPDEVRRRLRALDDAVKDLQGEAGPQLTAEQARAWNRQIHDSLAYLNAVHEGSVDPNTDVKLSPYGRAWVVNPDGTTAPAANQLPHGNVAALGRTLFTDHLISVELGGTLLLVATAGAIAIAGTRQKGARA